MQRFRYLVAIGVGAAIALSFTESDALQEVPSLPKNGKEASCLRDTQRHSQTGEEQPKGVLSPVHCSLDAINNQPAASPVQGSGNSGSRDVQSVALPQKIAAPKTSTKATVAQANRPASATVVDSIFPKAAPKTSTKATVAQANRPASATVVNSIFPKSEQRQEPQPQALAEPLPKPVPAIIEPNRSANSQTSEPENIRRQSEPLGGIVLVQSQPSVAPQPERNNPGTPAPEYLNPSANPLLFPTQAEEVQIKRAEVITLEQAIELGRRNNRDLQAARLTLERNQFALQEALAAEFPTAGLVLDFTRSDSASARLSNTSLNDDNPLLNRNPVSTTFNGSVQLSYDLFTSGLRPATIRASEQQVRFQELEVERLSEQVRLNVTRAYYNLQEADAQVQISQAAVGNAAQILRDTQLQEQAGLGTRFDVLQTQVSFANASQDLTRALSQQRVSRRQIVQLLSLAQPADVSAVETITEAGTWDLSLEQTIVLAFKNRAELEQQLIQRNIGEQRRLIALAANRPRASLTANYNILGVLNDDAGPSQGLTIGARLQWNLFDGGAARSRARQETTNIAIAENTFASQRNQIRFDVEQAFFTLDANRQNIQTATFALQAAQESLRLARLRFGAGVGTNTDVINQLTELTRAQVNQLRAVLDYNRALADLQRAVSNFPDSNLFDLP